MSSNSLHSLNGRVKVNLYSSGIGTHSSYFNILVCYNSFSQQKLDRQDSK